MFRELKDTLYRTMSLLLFGTFYDWTAGQQKHTFGIDFIASDDWHFPGCVVMKMIARCPVRSAECTDNDRIW